LKYPFEKEHVCEKGLQKKSDWTLEKPTVTRIPWKKSNSRGQVRSKVEIAG
jgi:hypothetical protein